ncbi:Starch-binding associating with outer membrane [Chitinophaga jiangningensis]|uniref:Starch-binding associating with outer membrane n=1 Tax=Chitinophaga jiangningensis TaxID=1419482 RepID=A0A1M7FH58_9BACT|nr:RagB/SusD family nutrient uptake outer membrane protein [Chitinophaga jiangningensis]SHM03305.1 Starch-binding associating with outer membrane [Chitinophaga jiangningensis]
MKKTTSYILLLAAGFWTASCNKEFLQKNPQTSIVPDAYFGSPKDLETYSNSFYAAATYATDDINSDNISYYSQAGELDLMMEGGLNATTVGNTGWNDWGRLRSYNYLLDNAHKATGDTALIHHYIGITRFFRAKFYFDKLARYSDVPWYSHVLSNIDSALYAPRSPRTLIADSIMADLRYAITYIKPDEGNRTRISKWTALALMSRFGLFEGTFRKYHPELKLQETATPFLEAAVTASQELINSGRFQVYNTGKGALDYRALFVSSTLASNREMIQWFECQQALKVGNNTHAVLGWTWSISNSLVETYLMKDGTPFTSQPDYNKKGFVEVFANRDPRLAETVAYPGFSTTNDDKYYIPKPNLGGFDQLKFYPRDPAQRQGWDANYTSLPLYRYAEVLLNYAEAKAELGSLTQDDLTNSVNKLRARVQMPDLLMANANANPDPVQAAAYSNVSGGNKGVLLEIRRERRVEMACEGLRLNDLNRWAAAAGMEQAQQGMYVPALGPMDITGDGIADIAILATPNDTASLAGLPPAVKQSISRYALKDVNGKENNFYLDNNTSGHISFTRYRDNKRKFVAPQYYYRPISFSEVVLNPNLTQIQGW